ncbi:MAG: hypothetical protein R6T90_01945 [Dissulfuribacterales bacterium]
MTAILPMIWVILTALPGRLEPESCLTPPGNDRNMIMWSWCGQVSGASEDDINTYLGLMNQLEQEYPEVNFVYMTGHLDGTSEAGKRSFDRFT